MELLDATLREGEQRSGHRYSVAEKVAAARELDALGVSFVEVGFPVADDRTRRICDRLDVETKTVGIARAIDRDVDAAAAAGVDVIGLFAPTSDRQRERLLGATREELRETIADALDRARETGREVHFTAMDGFRTDPDFLRSLIDEVDVPYFTIADTVGARTPRDVREFLAALDADLSTVGVHFHDDLGVATANALAAADAGAGKADVSVAGVGERAGNTALEEFVTAASVGGESIDLSVDANQVIPRAEAVVAALGESVAPQKPILGAGVFEHESGLHTAAMLDDPATFEPFDPAAFGGERRLLFGRSTGRGAARRLLSRVGREPTDGAVDALLAALDAAEDRTLDEALSLAERVEV